MEEDKVNIFGKKSILQQITKCLLKFLFLQVINPNVAASAGLFLFCVPHHHHLVDRSRPFWWRHRHVGCEVTDGEERTGSSDRCRSRPEILTQTILFQPFAQSLPP